MRAGGWEGGPTPGTGAAAHLDGGVRHGKVRSNAQGQQQVEDGWLDPEGQSMGSRTGERSSPQTVVPWALAHHSPVGVHHLL